MSSEGFWTGVWSNAVGTVLGGIILATIGVAFWEVALWVAARRKIDLVRGPGFMASTVLAVAATLILILLLTSVVVEKAGGPDFRAAANDFADFTPAVAFYLFAFYLLVGRLGRRRMRNETSTGEVTVRVVRADLRPSDVRVAGHRRRPTATGSVIPPHSAGRRPSLLGQTSSGAVPVRSRHRRRPRT